MENKLSLCYDFEKWTMISLASVAISLTVIVLSSSLDSKVYGVTVNETFFSVNLSNNWAYARGELSNAEGSGIYLIPTEFSDLLTKTDEQDLQKMLQNLRVFAFMVADTNSPFRNVPLEIYAQHRFDNTSEEVMSGKINATIDGEKALKFYGTVADNSTVRDKIVTYLVVHDGVPYMLEYSAILKDFEKYLPQFENMVKSFRFVGGPNEIENLSDNDNLTNTRGQIDYDSKQWEEWVEEQINNVFETEFNITGIESEQEMRIKMAIGICNNPEHYSTLIGIEPEVFKYRCDFVMKELRDRGLIK